MSTFNKNDWYWQLADGRVWSTKAAAFVAEEEAAPWAEVQGMERIPASPVDTAGEHSEQGLREALRFYGLPLGELAEPSDLGLGQDYELDGEVWRRVRYTRKDFMLWCGLDKLVALNAAINAGNYFVKTVLDLLQASEYISLKDPATAQMLGMLATPDGGQILAPADVSRILAGEEWTDA